MRSPFLVERRPRRAGVAARQRAAPLVAAVAVLLAMLAGGAAADPLCPEQAPAIDVTVSAAPPRIDNTLPQIALQKKAAKTTHAGRALGLYHARLGGRQDATIGSRRRGGEVCVFVRDVHAALTLSDRMIWIIRERRPGTCAYEAVLTHERRHEEADDAVLAEARERLRQSLGAALAGTPPRPAPAPDEAALRAALGKRIEGAFRSALDAAHELREERQKAVDTPTEYRRVAAACPSPAPDARR
jgi:hypothetical protein